MKKMMAIAIAFAALFGTALTVSTASAQVQSRDGTANHGNESPPVHDRVDSHSQY